ncbi:Acetyl esterase/lipase, partial [Epilithonimonas zeae]
IKEIELTDIKYGSYERNKMDIYLPANRTNNTPFVVNIHGGAWTVGDKSTDTSLSKYLLSRGIAVANINYRYANNNTHLSELLDDVDKIFKYLITHSKEWNTRSTGFSITGQSSGAHVSLMYAYTKSDKIKAIVDRCGPTDFTDTSTLWQLDNQNLMDAVNKMSGNKTVWKEGNPIPELYIKSSPVKFVKKIPILMIHGDKDPIVPIKQSFNLIEALKEENVPYKLLIFQGADHSLDALPGNSVKKITSTADWIIKYGKN